jgi:thioredoxin 1
MVGAYVGRVKFCYVDIQNAPNAANRFGVRSVPTLIMFKNGSPSGSLLGAQPRPKLEELISRAL